MRKLVGLAGLAGVCLMVLFASCKSSESAYKKAYESAKQQETTSVTAPPVTPIQSGVASEAVVRKEKVTVISGSDGLKAYCVVCGSFSLKANAESLRSFLISEGYSKAGIAFNPETVMYRVIVDSFNEKSSAADCRDAFKAKHPHRTDFQESWILQRLY